MISKSAVLSLILLPLSVAATPPRLISNDSVCAPTVADAASPAGLWQMGGDGAVFSVSPVPGRTGVYNLTLISSPDFTVPPEAHFGTMTRTGAGQSFDAALGVNPFGRKGRPGRTENFIIELSDDGNSLSFKHYRRGKRLNIFRLLPYLFRISLSDIDTRPGSIDGAERLSSRAITLPVTL